MMDYFRPGVVMLLLAGLLNGCAAVVVGGAAAGGYYVVKDERSLGEMTTDAKITASVNSRFFSDDLVSPIAINVDTFKGEVTLKGTVDNLEEARRSYALAYSVEGVTQVISELNIRSVPMSAWGPVDK